MKRLITILLSFIGCVSLFGQTVPMVVAGKVHVSGPIRSEGTVHVYASVDTGKIDIDNTGATTLLATNEIIFYSNDSVDGLLRNVNTKGGGVKGILNSTTLTDQPATVAVRKDVEKEIYTYVSFPFHVAKANVFKVNNGTRASTSVPGGDTQSPNNGDGSGDYYAVEFNAKVRSDSNTVDADKTFTEVDYSKGFKKGTGYSVWYAAGADRGALDFVTDNPDSIKALFSVADKSKTFDIYGANDDLQLDNPEYNDGWAFIGGLNSTTFTYNDATVGGYFGSGEGYGNSIWYRNQRTAQARGVTNEITGTDEPGKYKVKLLSVGEDLNIGPYTPFFIQAEVEKRSGKKITGSFISKSGGLTLESAKFRSVAENEMKDRLYFALSSDKYHSKDRFYVVFADNYSEAYKASEDAITMSTSYNDSPAVWCLQDGTNRELALNGLPMKDEREIRMGFSVPQAGDYTFNMDAMRLTDVRNVILADNVTGRKVDLLQTSYSFNTAGKVEKENNRFVLYINSSYTDVPTIASGLPYAYVKDNLLTIKNLAEGDKVSVYDLAGRAIVSSQVSGKEFSTVLSQKGVFVVNVKGGRTSVLKVLNK